MKETLQFDVRGSSRDSLKNQAEKIIKRYFNMSPYTPVEQQVSWSMNASPHIRGDDEIIGWEADVTATLKEPR